MSTEIYRDTDGYGVNLYKHQAEFSNGYNSVSFAPEEARDFLPALAEWAFADSEQAVDVEPLDSGVTEDALRILDLQARVDALEARIEEALAYIDNVNRQAPYGLQRWSDTVSLGCILTGRKGNWKAGVR